MKKLLSLIFFALISFSVYAGPFGLKMGMTLDEIAEVCDGKSPAYMQNDCYEIFPSKTHPLFQKYIVFIDKERGLYCIRALSIDISSNQYGTEIKNAFSQIRERISKIYGTPRVIDEIAPDYILKEDLYWLTALSVGARTYAAFWETNSTNKLKDDLQTVSMWVTGQLVPSTGWIILQYDFSNKQSVEDEQDDVF